MTTIYGLKNVIARIVDVLDVVARSAIHCVSASPAVKPVNAANSLTTAGTTP